MNNSVNLLEKLKKFDDFWSPRVIAEMNDYQVKIAKFKGEFTWHDHKDTDELFFVVSGSMRIEFQYGYVTLDEGEIYVVPKGVTHKPVAETECHVMLIEPKGVINTGDIDSELKAENNVWV
ncbi:cupin domain-containing protein [Vibrio harveyi]|uniref:cupin domain-containing protein n=1 Tax=Vibrio harveyi TaxID=669 RepID=UPI003BB57CBC